MTGFSTGLQHSSGRWDSTPTRAATKSHKWQMVQHGAAVSARPGDSELESAVPGA